MPTDQASRKPHEVPVFQIDFAGLRRLSVDRTCDQVAKLGLAHERAHWLAPRIVWKVQEVARCAIEVSNAPGLVDLQQPLSTCFQQVGDRSVFVRRRPFARMHVGSESTDRSGECFDFDEN